MPIFSSEETFRDFFYASLEATVVVDDRGRIVHWNAEAENLFGHPAAAASGRPMAELLIPPESQRAFQDDFMDYLRQGPDGDRSRHLELSLLRADGGRLQVEITARRLRIDAGHYVTVCMRDISERKQMLQSLSQALDTLERTNRRLAAEVEQGQKMHAALARSEKMYRSIIESTAEGFWMFSPHDLVIRETNHALCQMLGLSREEIIGRTPLDFCHDKAQSRMREYLPAVLETDHRTFEMTFKGGDGQMVHSHVNCTTIRNGAGEPWVAFAFLTDISESKRMEEKALKAYAFRIAISALLETGLEPLTLSRQLEAVLNIILTIPKLSVENRGAIFLWDETAGKLTLVAQSGFSVDRVRTCSSIDSGHCLCGRVVARGEPVLMSKADAARLGEGECTAGTTLYGTPIHSKGAILGVILLAVGARYVRDPEEEAFMTTIGVTLASLIDRRRAEEKIRHLARHDALTGLPNRRTFEERLEHELAQARRERSHVAILFLDLDGFKAVNDTRGHDIGDRVLVEVAERIRGCLRTVDMVARFGGDEFAVILHAVTNQEDAGHVAGKIIDLIARAFLIDGRACHLGVSIGIALFPDHGGDSRTLMKNADGAMYDAKRGGRGIFRYC